VIPGTLLGALFLAACLVPGFIFLRIAEQRSKQASRSTLLEAVELAGVGAAASLSAATITLLVVTRWLDAVDASALADDPGRYLLLHPARGLGPMLASFALSCVLAWAAAQMVFVRHQSVFHPGGTSWIQALWEDRPSAEHVVLVTIELTDGRRVIGLVRSFTTEFVDNREITLGPPIGAQANPAAQMVQLDDDFLILREDEIASIVGRYIPRPEHAPATASLHAPHT
jgi:hypothetical protein